MLTILVLSSLLPHFQAEGNTYFFSKDCSHNSLSILLSFNPTNLDIVEEMPVWQTEFVLDYNSMAVTANGHEEGSLTEVLKDVALVKAGNRCFPVRPELDEVVEYLSKYQL